MINTNPPCRQPKWVDQEDARKLHAEINQLSNQRAVLTTFAMTIFLAGNAAIISIYNSDKNAIRLLILFSLIIELFLFSMFYLSNTLRHVSRCEAMYLMIKGYTNWEAPWKKFREKDGYSGLAVAQIIIFKILLFFQSTIPILIYLYLKIPNIRDIHDFFRHGTDFYISKFLDFVLIDIDSKIEINIKIFLICSPLLLLLFLLNLIKTAQKAYGDKEKQAFVIWGEIMEVQG